MKTLAYSSLALLVIGLYKIRQAIRIRYDYGFYYINKEEEEIVNRQIDEIVRVAEEAEANALDLRGTPTHECICGSNIWSVRAIFQDFEISSYFLDMQCMECGTLATAPTPLDRESME
jgi:hypothetical protein